MSVAYPPENDTAMRSYPSRLTCRSAGGAGQDVPKGAKVAADVEPASSGKHHVEHDDVKTLAARKIDPLFAVECSLHAEPLALERVTHRVHEVRLVVDQKHPERSRLCLEPPRTHHLASSMGTPQLATHEL
jgi:hypothetical protein